MLLLYDFHISFYILLISSSRILPLNIPFVFVWCYTVATFAHRVLTAYFVGGETTCRHRTTKFYHARSDFPIVHTKKYGNE
jgi:hypothetical protein